MDKWSCFYSSLSRSKRNKVTGVLKELKNLKTLAVLDDVKIKLMNKPKIIDGLPDQKELKKDPDILI